MNVRDFEEAPNFKLRDMCVHEHWVWSLELPWSLELFQERQSQVEVHGKKGLRKRFDA
jgi:hypothetical protein